MYIFVSLPLQLETYEYGREVKVEFSDRLMQTIMACSYSCPGKLSEKVYMVGISLGILGTSIDIRKIVVSDQGQGLFEVKIK